MFIVDFVVQDILNQVSEWFYEQIMSFCNTFLYDMNQMGAEIFDLPWIISYLEFVSLLAWALFIIGGLIGFVELSIEYMDGKGDIKGYFINMIKGFMATGLLTTLPVELYRFSITLVSSITSELVEGVSVADRTITLLSNDVFAFTGGISLIFLLLLIYTVVKVFFFNLKRGGILLVLISLGSFHLFSVPRGYTDAFVMWIKQIISLCFTAFMQTVLLSIGLMVCSSNTMLGIGIALSATEVPRIAERFGMDTSFKPNVTSSIYAASSAVNLGRALSGVVR